MKQFLLKAGRVAGALRRQRVEWMIVAVVAAILFVVADTLIVGGVRWIAPDAADALAAWRPAIRKPMVGGLAALIFLVFCLRPYWREVS